MISRTFINNYDVLKSDETSLEKRTEIFGEWGIDFENDMKLLNYNMHTVAVDLIEKVVASNFDLSKSSTILEVGVGTGLVGEKLRERGFTGTLDAHDGSKKMLEVAGKKGVYNQFFCHIVKPNTKIPDKIATGRYDILVTVGTLWKSNALHYDCLPQLLKCIRVGGIIVFTIQKPDRRSLLDFKLGLERKAFDMEEQGLWQLIDIKFCPDYQKVAFPEKECKLDGFAYCYKKTGKQLN